MRNKWNPSSWLLSIKLMAFKWYRFSKWSNVKKSEYRRIIWDKNKDCFQFTFTPKISTSENNELYCHFLPLFLILRIKILSSLLIQIIMQELWIPKISWDESIHGITWRLEKVFFKPKKFAFDRYSLATDFEEVQGFCESSIWAYGCYFYLRVKDLLGNNSVRLLDVELHPLKKIIAKTRIMWCTVITKLYSQIKHMLSIFNIKFIFWIDSQLVIHWLKQHSSTLSVFVGNRVPEIKDITNGCI